MRCRLYAFLVKALHSTIHNTLYVIIIAHFSMLFCYWCYCFCCCQSSDRWMERMQASTIHSQSFWVCFQEALCRPHVHLESADCMQHNECSSVFLTISWFTNTENTNTHRVCVRLYELHKSYTLLSSSMVNYIY